MVLPSSLLLLVCLAPLLLQLLLQDCSTGVRLGLAGKCTDKKPGYCHSDDVIDKDNVEVKRTDIRLSAVML